MEEDFLILKLNSSCKHVRILSLVFMCHRILTVRWCDVLAWERQSHVRIPLEGLPEKNEENSYTTEEVYWPRFEQMTSWILSQRTDVYSTTFGLKFFQLLSWADYEIVQIKGNHLEQTQSKMWPFLALKVKR